MNNYPTMNQHVQGANQMTGGDIKTHCKKHMNYHVIGRMRDGSEVAGILTDMNHEGVTMLVPEWADDREVDRQPYGYRPRFRRFRPRFFPFSFFLFPFFRPYPYFYPYY